MHDISNHFPPQVKQLQHFFFQNSDFIACDYNFISCQFVSSNCDLQFIQIANNIRNLWLHFLKLYKITKHALNMKNIRNFLHSVETLHTHTYVKNVKHYYLVSFSCSVCSGVYRSLSHYVHRYTVYTKVCMHN